jgi:hypothetical protein
MVDMAHLKNARAGWEHFGRMTGATLEEDASGSILVDESARVSPKTYRCRQDGGWKLRHRTGAAGQGGAQCPYFSKKRTTMSRANTTTMTFPITAAKVADAPTASLVYFGNAVIGSRQTCVRFWKMPGLARRRGIGARTTENEKGPEPLLPPGWRASGPNLAGRLRV